MRLMFLIFPGRLTCELEDTAWEVDSSDKVVPELMELSVVILLGWPRSVRVMVVGTFKPERKRIFVISQFLLSFPEVSSL